MEKDRGFKTKVQVFFTYYKWYILIALFFVVFITVMTVQMCTKEEYDISVMYAGNSVISDKDGAAVERSLGKLGKDGESSVLYELFIMSDEELNRVRSMTDEEFFEVYGKDRSLVGMNYDSIPENKKTLAAQMFLDEYFVLLLSPDCYNILANGKTQYLEKLTDIGINALPEQLYSERAIELHSLEFAKVHSAFSAFPDDTLVCFKKISQSGKKDDKRLEKRKHDIAILSNMVSYSALGNNAEKTACIQDVILPPLPCMKSKFDL